jgi:multisubunit Na+/H+ antiporter MnhB subunit
MSETPTAASETRKPPLTARQAMSISLGGLGVGVVVLVLACTLYLVPFWQAVIWYAIGAFFLLAYPWACLEWETKNRAVRAHNLFVYFTMAIVVVALVVQWKPKEEPFPKWAIAAIITAGVAAYSVMARHAIANFQNWRHGDFRSLDAKKT